MSKADAFRAFFCNNPDADVERRRQMAQDLYIDLKTAESRWKDWRRTGGSGHPVQHPQQPPPLPTMSKADAFRAFFCNNPDADVERRRQMAQDLYIDLKTAESRWKDWRRGV
ncbi:hypothetical protein BDZ89DRAFT_1058648 [Hymenopellis radicata]|nr:hypothetical protein BDZ89DRAFT_1058648 [Hymenopellis radicata]